MSRFSSAPAFVIAMSASFWGLQATAQSLRFVDPAIDGDYLPLSGGALNSGGDDAQIIRFRNWERLSPTREILTGNYVLRLPENSIDFGNFSYSVEEKQHSLDDFMRHNHVAGLLVIKNGEVKQERYGLGNNDSSHWVSFSVTKSVTSMLLGAAIQDGFIASVDDLVTDYLPRLKGSAYDQVSLRDVLQMASGVAWNEDYADPNSDVATYPGRNTVALYQFLGAKPRVAPPGTSFNYNTGETDLVGAIVRAAIGNNLATYLEHKIWKPFGMEANASWATHGTGGGERGGCCISATLRDFGRLGLFAMQDGLLADGTRVLPTGWMKQSTRASAGSSAYGYLWWLEDGGNYRASGIFGQGIYIDPESSLVVVVLSAWPVAKRSDFELHRDSFFKAVDTYLTP